MIDRTASWNLLIGVLSFFAVAMPVLASASEVMKCNQVFENASEKRICESPEMLALDAKMADLYEQAKLADKSVSKTRRAFRKARKQCKGDAACLADLYDARISELQALIANTSRSIEQEGSESTEAAAEEVLDNLEAAESSLPVVTAPQASASDYTTPATSSVDEMQDVTMQSPASGTSVVAVDQMELLARFGRILSILPWWVWASGGFLLLVFTARKKCPRCGKRGTTKEIDRKYEGTSTEYRDVDVRDEHRDRAGNLLKTVNRTEQRAQNVDHYILRMRCTNCRHEWTTRASS